MVKEPLPGDQENSVDNSGAEAFHGDFVISKSLPLDGQPGKFLHRIVKEDSGQELIRARTAWKRSDHES